jgi:tetratricopeptide (TPR) repeat protein
MKPRKYSLIFLLVLGLLLGLTQQWWSPWLWRQLQFIESRSALLQGLNALIGLLIWVGNAVMFYVLWLTRPEKKGIALDKIPLETVTREQLLAELGRWGGSIAWVDRNSTRLSQVQIGQRLAIMGQRKLGKTREAIELIAQAVDNDLITPDHIYVPGRTLLWLTQEEIEVGVANQIPPRAAVLLFIDDLPYHFGGKGLKALGNLIDFLSDHCRTLYLLATVRTDQWLESHKSWLIAHTFQLHDLAAFDDGQTAQIVNYALHTFEMQAGMDVQALFVQANDGTPERVMSVFRKLRSTGHSRLESGKVKEILAADVANTWDTIRVEVRQQHQSSYYLFLALGAFHAAAITPYTELVLTFAIELWRDQVQHPYRWQMRPALQKALRYLEQNYDFVNDGEIITFPDVAVEGIGEDELIQTALADYLIALPKKFSFRKLHYWLLFVWAEIRYRRSPSLHGYTLAIQTLPHADAYNRRGLIHHSQGEYELALRDYKRALELDPKNALHYYWTGALYHFLERREEAISIYQKAISVADANDSQLYTNLGDVYSELGYWSEAKTNFKKAIEINPTDTNSYIGLGGVYYELGRIDEAIAILQKAIELDPNDALSHSGLGYVYGQLGRTDEALVAYQKAVELEPSDGLSHASLAAVYRQLGQNSNYEKHISLARESLDNEDTYNRACVEAIAGNVAKAVTLLKQALTEDTDMRDWAKQDPDFDFIRDDPRFQALMGVSTAD